MELIERISELQSSAKRQLDVLNSRKKTENALILPFFRALGYDPFDVREVEPDFDVGLENQGMKTVDYALKKDEAPVMLFQCEKAEADLGSYDNSFLFQYFDALRADVAVFANGLHYRFYANLDAGINVDRRPFLEFNLLDHRSEQVEELRHLTKASFDAEEILSAAYNRKCGQLLRNYFVQQQQSPDEHLVRFMAAQIYEGEVSDDVLERFRPVVQNVLGGLVDSEEEQLWSAPRGDDELEAAEEAESGSPEEEEPADLNTEEDVKLTTSDEDPSANEGEGASGDEDELDGEDPFDKDLARRVIDDF